ncbi:MAG: FtsX-like permease family protein [Candidatus Aminicenantales bacterium]
MKLSDHIELAFSNLRKRKLRAFLTAFGVTIGIGALVSMVSFGKGMQKNLTESFRSLDLFNSITVFAEDFMSRDRFDPDERPPAVAPTGSVQAVLDDAAMEKIAVLKGVETVFPEIRFPAIVRFNEKEEFRLVQVIPAKVASSKAFRFNAGRGYASDDESSLVLSKSFLRQLGVDDPEAAVGKTVTISSIAFDFSRLNPLDLAATMSGEKLPFQMEDYELTVVGVTDSLAFSGPMPIQSDVFIPPAASQRMKKLPFSNIWDIFLAKEGRLGYSALNVRLSSPAFVEPVKREVSAMGFQSFALADQFEEVQRGFLVMNMILAAVGMIAIVVASLGIVNTMVMSILERYSEIGIMKAVGASDRDIRRIFFFESSIIGFVGGVFGLALGWVVSGIINRIVNYFLSRQGVPFFQYFSFPAWLCLGAIAFSVVVSLAAGIYPAMRAARVDPVRALRHD